MIDGTETMSERANLSEPSTAAEDRSGLLYGQWQRSSRGLDYEQWRKNQLGVGFEQWILDQPKVEYEQWVKTELGKDYERLITDPLSVKPPPRTVFEDWSVGILPLGISFIVGFWLMVLLVAFDFNAPATLGVFVGLGGWSFLLAHERDAEYQIAALESRPEDMTRNIWLSLKLGVRRRMKVSKYRGWEQLIILLLLVPITLASWTVLAVELLNKI